MLIYPQKAKSCKVRVFVVSMVVVEAIVEVLTSGAAVVFVVTVIGKEITCLSIGTSISGSTTDRASTTRIYALLNVKDVSFCKHIRYNR
jgi:hypothetical protein